MGLVEVQASWLVALGSLQDSVSVSNEAEPDRVREEHVILKRSAVEGPCELTVLFSSGPGIVSSVLVSSSAKTCELYTQSWGAPESEYECTVRASPTLNTAACAEGGAELSVCKIPFSSKKPLASFCLRLLSLRQKEFAEVQFVQIVGTYVEAPIKEVASRPNLATAGALVGRLPALLGGLAALNISSSAELPLVGVGSKIVEGNLIGARRASSKGGSSSQADQQVYEKAVVTGRGTSSGGQSRESSSLDAICERLEGLEQLVRQMEGTLTRTLEQFEQRLQRLEAAQGRQATESAAPANSNSEQTAEAAVAVTCVTPVLEGVSMEHQPASPSKFQSPLRELEPIPEDPTMSHTSEKGRARTSSAPSHEGQGWHDDPGIGASALSSQDDQPVKKTTGSAAVRRSDLSGTAVGTLKSGQRTGSSDRLQSLLHERPPTPKADTLAASGASVDCAAALRAMVEEAISACPADGTEGELAQRVPSTLPRSPSLELLLAQPAPAVDLFVPQQFGHRSMSPSSSVAS